MQGYKLFCSILYCTCTLLLVWNPFYPTFMDNSEPIEIQTDAEEACRLSAQWDKTAWIGRGKKYMNVPEIVLLARRDLLTIPPEYLHHFPPSDLPLSQLLQFDLPTAAFNDNSVDLSHAGYSNDDPDSLSDIIRLLPITSSQLQDELTVEFGQAWFDGKMSVRDGRTKYAYPFWVLSYWAVMRRVHTAKSKWLAAMSWLNKVDRSSEERALKQSIFEL